MNISSFNHDLSLYFSRTVGLGSVLFLVFVPFAYRLNLYVLSPSLSFKRLWSQAPSGWTLDEVSTSHLARRSFSLIHIASVTYRQGCKTLFTDVSLRPLERLGRSHLLGIFD